LRYRQLQNTAPVDNVEKFFADKMLDEEWRTGIYENRTAIANKRTA